MSDLNDQSFSLEDQYKNASNLTARRGLHARFSVNPYGFTRWVFDHLTVPASARILELGCGEGSFWKDNASRIPAGWDIILSDAFPGMLDDARQNLGDRASRFKFSVIDAQAIPLADHSFDAVLANHMLYHVPDRPAALGYIHRILKPGGILIATTNGRNHLNELLDLVRQFNPAIDAFTVKNYLAFGLENGAGQLSHFFPDVQLFRYEDALAVTDPGPLADYIRSTRGNARAILVGETLERFVRLLENKMKPQGILRLTKDSGLFKCVKGA